jgi:hypothetical protein
MKVKTALKILKKPFGTSSVRLNCENKMNKAEIKEITDWIDRAIKIRPVVYSESGSRLIESIARQLDSHKRGLKEGELK